ncbi:MAG: MBL fold metallo-hydrolase [Xanthomonadales bacterium]|nr:MBL fold metallo-hydrolase [Xanthomonadales bacterium]
MIGGFLLAAVAQAGNFESGRFEVTVEQLTDDVYVMRRVPSWRYWVQANVTVIVNESDVVVVDGGYPKHVENVIAEIKKITDKPVGVVLITHWHQDHNFGIHLYRRHYPDVRFISHENTRSALARRNEDAIPRVTGEGYHDRLVGILEERIEKGKAEGDPSEVISFYEDYLAGADEIAADLKGARNNLSDETFSRRLVLHRPGRRIEILHLGHANTEGDAMLWLPDEKILTAGDVVVHPTPYGFGSYPQQWAATLRKMNALGYDMLVPGHGQVQRDTTYVSLLIDVLTSVAAQVDAAVAAGASSLEAVRKKVDLQQFDSRFTGGDPLLLHLFEVWFKSPIVQAAYEHARENRSD